MTETGKTKELTGRHVALIFCGAFAVIIAVNLALAYFAVGTFPGLDTRKPYNESLTFESRREAQVGLNWSSSVSYKDGQVTLTLTEVYGGSVITPNISMVIRHATSKKYDQEVELNFDGHNYVGNIDLPAGNWQARIAATSLEGIDFRRTLSLYLKKPAS